MLSLTSQRPPHLGFVERSCYATDGPLSASLSHPYYMVGCPLQRPALLTKFSEATNDFRSARCAPNGKAIPLEPWPRWQQFTRSYFQHCRQRAGLRIEPAVRNAKELLLTKLDGARR